MENQKLMSLREKASELVSVLSQAGHVAYFAGGWVRDFLMGRTCEDVDIATDAAPEEVEQLFPHTIPVGIAFGIVVVIHEGHHFEVATFRQDLGYRDGRRPVGIVKSSPREDAQRRDFTINGLFYDPLQDRIYDYVGGEEDLKRRLIRAIGEAKERFQEDRLRLLRAVRFASTFDFAIEQKTWEAIQSEASQLLSGVSMERVTQELRKMAEGDSFPKALSLLHQSGLLSTIFPALASLTPEELAKCIAPLQHFPSPCPLIAKLLQLFPDATLQEGILLCHYLKMSNEEKHLAERLLQARRLVHCTSLWEWAHFYALPESWLCLQVVAANQSDGEKFLQHHHRLLKRLHPHVERIQRRTPLVTAFLLEKEGIHPGKVMGQLLQVAEKIAIEEDLHFPEDVLRKLKASPSWS